MEEPIRYFPFLDNKGALYRLPVMAKGELPTQAVKGSVVYEEVDENYIKLVIYTGDQWVQMIEDIHWPNWRLMEWER